MSTCMHVLDASDAEVGFTEKGLNRKKLHNMHEHAIEKKNHWGMCTRTRRMQMGSHANNTHPHCTHCMCTAMYSTHEMPAHREGHM